MAGVPLRRFDEEENVEEGGFIEKRHSDRPPLMGSRSSSLVDRRQHPEPFSWGSRQGSVGESSGAENGGDGERHVMPRSRSVTFSDVNEEITETSSNTSHESSKSRSVRFQDAREEVSPAKRDHHRYLIPTVVVGVVGIVAGGVLLAKRGNCSNEEAEEDR